MYKIIGADGCEYGPVSADQIRQWIAEGRANAQTRAQGEGSADWRTLADCPEFHVALGLSGGAPPPISPPVQPRVVTRPPGADKKIAAGICGILLGPLGIHKFILGYTGEGVAMLLISVLTCGIGAIPMRIISLIEGIIYLTKSDEDFVQTYVLNKKGWF
jgi:TM2 domain-containing membrane protein YozV